MNATLTYELPDDEAAFQAASRALDWVETVREFDAWARNLIKHGHEFQTANQALAVSREKLLAIVHENGLRLYD